MKYIRTKNELVEFNIIRKIMPDVYEVKDIKDRYLHKEEILKQADTIEDLIQIGDIVFYWQQSDDKEHCCLMVYDSDITTLKYNAITKLLIPHGEDYKCVAKGCPSFNLIKGRRYLVNKGELELL